MTTTFPTLFKIIKALSLRNKILFLTSLFFSLLSGISELLLVFFSYPVLQKIINNNNDSFESSLFANVGIFNKSLQFIEKLPVLNLCIYFLLLIIACSAIRLANLRVNCYTAGFIGKEVSINIFFKVLNQKYDYFFLKGLNKNIETSLTTHITELVEVITALLQLFTGALVSILIIIGIFTLNVSLALATIFAFIIIYLPIVSSSRKILKNNSIITYFESTRALQIVSESILSIRDIILDDSSHIYTNLYSISQHRIRTKLANSKFIGSFSRFLIEGLGLSFIILFFIISELFPDSLNFNFAYAGLLALASQRLLPGMQLVYNGWSFITSNSVQINQLYNLTKLSVPLEHRESINKKPKFCEPVYKIEFKNVYFKYFGESKYVLNNVNLTLESGDFIYIVGPTGGGKSTLVDLLMGFLVPTSGSIFINDQPLKNKEQYKNYMSSIAHVPQKEFHFNDTVLNNITMNFCDSQSYSNYDLDKLELALSISNCKGFVESLVNGVDTNIGENAKLLSGGQSQRLAIARAIYKQKPILILDEATSALDKKSQKIIMKNLSALSTINFLIAISHTVDSNQINENQRFKFLMVKNSEVKFI